MSSPRKQPRSLAEIIQQVVDDRKPKAAARRKGGAIRGLQRSRDKATKLAQIFKAEIHLIGEGIAPRKMTKTIAQRLRLPVEYVMKARRSVGKE